MSELSELLKQAQDKDPMSARRRAERIDGRLHHATISAYLRGTHPDSPDEATLQALAEAFDLDLATVQAAAHVPVGVGPYVPPPESARLTRRQQAAITEIIMSMVESEGGQDGRQPEAQKSEHRLSTADDMGLAAHHAPSDGKIEHDRASLRGEESQDDGGVEPA